MKRSLAFHFLLIVNALLAFLMVVHAVGVLYHWEQWSLKLKVAQSLELLVAIAFYFCLVKTWKGEGCAGKLMSVLFAVLSASILFEAGRSFIEALMFGGFFGLPGAEGFGLLLQLWLFALLYIIVIVINFFYFFIWQKRT